MRIVHYVGITERWLGHSLKIVTSHHLLRIFRIEIDGKERELVINLWGACLIVVLLPY